MMTINCVDCGEPNKVKLENKTLDGGESEEMLIVCSSCEWPNVLRLSLINSNHDYRDGDWLRMHYVDRDLSMAAIAEKCGVSAMTIFHWLKRHNITTRRRGQR